MASEPEVAAGGWQTFQLVFMAAVLLAIASEALGAISALYIRPFVVNWLSGLMPPPSGQQVFLGNIQAESFYSNVIQNLINFVISPVLFLFVFYKLGPRIRTKLDSAYAGLLEFSFLGGVTGYVAGYVLTIGIISAQAGRFYSGDAWYILIPGVGISVIREAVIMSLFAFTGIFVGSLRHPSSAGRVPEEPASPSG